MVTVDPDAKPTVSVIVPARNEEACLGSCLQSLAAQAGLRFEVIVVDDGSIDRTHEIAESFRGVKVIDAGRLPPGWNGKSNAMQTGARVAQGEWLLFTDADTVHRPGSLVRTVAEAKQQGAALLSYSPEQEVNGFWQKAVMPVIFAELAATYRPSEVSNPASPAAAANGQYLLISREAFDAIGGYGRIASSLLEDVALARAVKASGRKIFFRYGADAVRTRMYRNFSELKAGWTKNLVLLFPSAQRLAVLRLLEFLLIVSGAILAMYGGASGHPRSAFAGGGIAIVMLILFFKRIRRAHFSWDANFLSLLGLPVFSYLLMRSRIFHGKGRVPWKGREYPGAAETNLRENRQNAGARSWST